MALAWLVVAGQSAAVAIEPRHARLIVAADTTIPADSDPRWREVDLPDAQTAAIVWYRVEFDHAATAGDDLWMVYVPYFYGGGRVWLNGEPIAAVPESSPTLRVRWERPLLLPLPASALREGRNVLHFRVASAHSPSGAMLPQIVVGTQTALQGQFDRRLFLVRTVPLITVVVGFIGGLFVLFIWWRRRRELLYGLAGLSALFWAMRTMTFVFDTLPAAWWPVWRLLYHASNGGFIVVLLLFGLALGRWLRRDVAIVLAAYWAIGPIVYVLGGASPDAERWVGRWWVAGLIPVGVAAALVAVAAAWRRPKFGVIAIAAAMSIALVAGVHDYLIAWRSPLLEAIAPRWAGHRFFLLHYGADALLLTLGLLLTSRFVRSLEHAEEANRTLEARVAEREREIAASYERIAVLQREQAATDERQRIMRDLHDGLGSQLLTSLSRAERGALPAEAMAETLRGSIDEMRIAIEALASDEQDFRTAFGNFRFRWDMRLRDAGIVPLWQVDLPDAVLHVGPHDTLQLLRILQEALTNVLKHAQARQVQVRLRQRGGRLEFEVEDDGRGPVVDAEGARPSGGRGLANMRARAEQLGAHFEIGRGAQGLRVRLELAIA
jgi:signal transduction histidine kinase